MAVSISGTRLPRHHRPVRHRLEYLVVLVFRLVAGLLPRRWLGALGAAIGSAFCRLDHRRRKTALTNVQGAFPERSFEECQVIVQQAFANLGRHVLDLLRFDAMSVERMMELVDIEGEERVEQALKAGRGIMFFGGHFGFWELQIMVHAARFGPIVMVARTLDNPWLESMIRRMRNRVGTRVVPREGAVRSLLRTLLKHQSVGMMVDQHIQDRSAVTVKFLGRPAATTSTIAALALRTRVPVIPVFALPLPGGRYRMVYEAPVELPDRGSPDPVLALTQRCSDVVEKYVRRYPELWLWMHRRWRVEPIRPERTEEAMRAKLKSGIRTDRVLRN